MRISDWSSDVCSSDLATPAPLPSRRPWRPASSGPAMTALPSSAPAVSGVETFLEMLAAERGAAQNTLEAYRRDLDAYAGFLAGRGGAVATAGPDEIRAFLGRLAPAGMEPRTRTGKAPRGEK